jgi:bifunctional non-homologous end joining protein LigD
MEDTTTLYFREGPSDKVYQASIRPKDKGFMVHFAYGRRGSTLNTGSKTQHRSNIRSPKASTTS